jgi:DegV family protein with EDD domain
MNIRIVTDSTSDLPSQIVEEENICVIPNILILEGKSYQDGKDITRESFYQMLPNLRDLPTTATASSGEYQKLYTQLFQDGADQIISIHAAGELSGILNAVKSASEQFAGKVHVIDSRQISLGLGFQVLYAARLARQGQSVAEIVDKLENLRHRLHVIAMFDTLKYVERSGRVSWARARLGSLLGIRPFISLKDGKVLSLGETRTRQKGIQRLMEMLGRLGPLEYLGIVHTNALEDASTFLAQTHPAAQNEPLVVNITTIIGTHIGPNALGFIAITPEGDKHR